MAVENKYVNTNLAADKLSEPFLGGGVGGAKMFAMGGTFEVAIADDDGSVYRIFKDINPMIIPVQFKYWNDAITSSTDWDVGLYTPTVGGVTGAVVSVALFDDGISMLSARARGSEVEGLANVAIANIGQTIGEILGVTVATRKPGYDIAFTANTVGSAVGTISYICIFAQGN